MNIQDIELLITSGESNTLEFKKSTAQLHGVVATLCAFLNGQGGVVLIGVNQDGKLLGQDVSDNTQCEIAKELAKIEPFIAIDTHYLRLQNDKTVIVMKVKKGDHPPYIYDGRAYHRNQSTTMRMPQNHYEQMLSERSQLDSWEELPAKECDITDLDHDEIRKAVIQGIAVGRINPQVQEESIEGILTGWHLIKAGKINNAAVVLFAKKAMPRYPQCHIKLGRFMGTGEERDLVDNRDFHGNAFYLLSQANLFIMNHLPVASFFDPHQFERQDKPALPVLAVREALVNALCHRSYSKYSGAITLAIYDDRMEIWNSGRLPSGLELKDLQERHSSIPRNEHISNVFYDRKFFEGWGSGTTTMLKLCREHGVPEPLFEEYSGGFSVTFKFKTPIRNAAAPLLLPDQTDLTLRQKEILKILAQHGKISLRDIVSLLLNPPASRTVGDDLAVLKAKGLVISEGSGRGSRWCLNK